MSVNFELHYLIGEMYLDNENIMRAHKKAILSEAATNALQNYAQTSYWESSAYRTRYRGGFCNQPTFEMHTEAETVNWWECFSPKEIEIIKDFCIKNGFEAAAAEIS